MWEVILSKKAQEDLKKLKSIGLFDKTKELVAILRENPFTNPPPYGKLVGNLQGLYSRRINIKHRLVYRGQRKQYCRSFANVVALRIDL